MSEETLFTAARRMVRFVMIDDQHGGLLSLETIQANAILSRMVAFEDHRQKKELEANERRINCSESAPTGPPQVDTGRGEPSPGHVAAGE